MKPREGKRNASYSIFTFWYWLPSSYVVTKVVGKILAEYFQKKDTFFWSAETTFGGKPKEGKAVVAMTSYVVTKVITPPGSGRPHSRVYLRSLE
jgi:hypothetical protein